MCIGEKRTLTIPPHKAYGKRSIGPIPADSTLGTFQRFLFFSLVFLARILNATLPTYLSDSPYSQT